RISERKMSASTGARSGIALLMLMRPRSVPASGRPELYRKRVAPHRTVAVRWLAGMPDGAVEQQQARRPRAHRDLGVARFLVKERLAAPIRLPALAQKPQRGELARSGNGVDVREQRVAVRCKVGVHAVRQIALARAHLRD